MFGHSFACCRTMNQWWLPEDIWRYHEECVQVICWWIPNFLDWGPIWSWWLGSLCWDELGNWRAGADCWRWRCAVCALARTSHSLWEEAPRWDYALLAVPPWEAWMNTQGSGRLMWSIGQKLPSPPPILPCRCHHRRLCPFLWWVPEWLLFDFVGAGLGYRPVLLWYGFVLFFYSAGEPQDHRLAQRWVFWALSLVKSHCTFW
jgi:hypothetical protein